MPRKEVKPRDQLTKKDLTCRSWYQEGFSKEGAELLARPWIKPEPPVNPNDFTLASFTDSERGFAAVKHPTDEIR